MTKSEYEIACIEHSSEQFNDLVERSNHSELVQCAKLLAMYIALYKRSYGEITMEDCLTTLQLDMADSDFIEIVQEGIEEASAMLSMIISERQQQLLKKEPPSPYIN